MLPTGSARRAVAGDHSRWRRVGLESGSDGIGNFGARSLEGIQDKLCRCRRSFLPEKADFLGNTNVIVVANSGYDWYFGMGYG